MKNKSPLDRFIDRVWRGPKAKVGGKIRQICEDMSHRQRLTVVTVLLSAFVLLAFFVFGHACYRMGAKRAVFEYEVEHLHRLELLKPGLYDYPDMEIENKKQELHVRNYLAYDDSGMESED